MTLPASQQRFSNVATVRLSKAGKRLEIACYKNKVVAYRSGVESRLDEVLQVERIFTNLSKGHYASLEEIKHVLGKDFVDEASAILFILQHGELQVAQNERTNEMDNLMKDISTVVSQKCVHADTNRPFPVAIIEQSIKKLGIHLKLEDTAKKQALLIMHKLIDSQLIPIQRAQMKVRCSGPVGLTITIQDWFLQSSKKRTSEEPIFSKNNIIVDTVTSGNGQFESLVLLLEPRLFREVEALCETVQVVESAVMKVTEGMLEDEKTAGDNLPTTKKDPITISTEEAPRKKKKSTTWEGGGDVQDDDKDEVHYEERKGNSKKDKKNRKKGIEEREEGDAEQESTQDKRGKKEVPQKGTIEEPQQQSDFREEKAFSTKKTHFQSDIKKVDATVDDPTNSIAPEKIKKKDVPSSKQAVLTKPVSVPVVASDDEDDQGTKKGRRKGSTKKTTSAKKVDEVEKHLSEEEDLVSERRKKKKIVVVVHDETEEIVDDE